LTKVGENNEKFHITQYIIIILFDSIQREIARKQLAHGSNKNKYEERVLILERWRTSERASERRLLDVASILENSNDEEDRQ